MYADSLESALRNLEGAHQQLETARNTLAARENDILDLKVQGRNLKKGMVSVCQSHPHPSLFPKLIFSQDTAMSHYNAMARELDDMKDSHANCSQGKRSFLSSIFRSASGSKIRELQGALSKAQIDLETIRERWQNSHHGLVCTEIVLREQRECMKVRISALRHTRDELAVVRGQLRGTERELEARKASLDVLRQNNRDLMLEIACLKHRTAERMSARNFTV